MTNKRPTVIKKYSNRRLYDTSTSSYINLSGVCTLIKNNEDFIIIEANTEKDITRGVLVQIILDYETKGYDLLPVEFLKNLIKFYEASSKDVVTHFLENSSKFFSKCQEHTKLFNTNFSETFDGTKLMEEISNLTQKNMDFFFKTFTSGNSFKTPTQENTQNESENTSTSKTTEKEHDLKETEKV